MPEPPATAVSLPGDVWVLGNHRALCSDARSAADVARVLAGGRANMIFCDPPYNVNYSQPSAPRGRSGRKVANDNLGLGFEQFLGETCGNLLEVTQGAVYICMSSSQLDTLKRVFVAAGGHWSTFVIWAKISFTLGRSDYQRQYQPIL